MTYSTLTGSKSTAGSVRYLINFAEIDAESIVRDSENWLNQNLRLRRLQDRAYLTLNEGESEIDLATNVPLFLDPVRLWLQGTGALPFIHEDEIDRWRDAETDGTLTTGAPNFWTLSNTTMLFDMEADDAYNLVFSHYAKPEPLAATTNETNLYTDEYPALMRKVVTAYAYIERKEEERAAALFAMADNFINKLKVSDDQSRRSMEFTVNVSR